jgi:hypothetical protein
VALLRNGLDFAPPPSSPGCRFMGGAGPRGGKQRIPPGPEGRRWRLGGGDLALRFLSCPLDAASTLRDGPHSIEVSAQLLHDVQLY